MTGYDNVAISDVDYRKGLKTIAVTPKSTVYNLLSSQSKNVYIKNMRN